MGNTEEGVQFTHSQMGQHKACASLPTDFEGLNGIPVVHAGVSEQEGKFTQDNHPCSVWGMIMTPFANTAS